MGHKVHPIGFRIGIVRDWQAKWYADKDFGEFVREDLKLRDAIQSRYPEAGISQVEISRQANEVFITIHTSRPGVVIGRGGQRVDEMRLFLEQAIGKRVRLNIMEVQQPELDATLVAKTVAEQMARRIAYRRAMKQAISRIIQAGAKGVRIRCAGRLGGAEIARSQTLHEGQVPLHTLRADIDYGFSESHTTFGRIGVKVWIYKGEILPEAKIEPTEEVTPVEGEEVPEEEGAEEISKAAESEITEELAAKLTGEAEPKPAEEAPVVAEPPPAEEAAVIAEAEKTEEAAPPAEAPVKKPAKPRTRRAKATPSMKPEAQEAAAGKEAGEEEPKPAEDIAKEAESSVIEKEGEDVTTETGKAPEGS